MRLRWFPVFWAGACLVIAWLLVSGRIVGGIFTFIGLLIASYLRGLFIAWREDRAADRSAEPGP